VPGYKVWYLHGEDVERATEVEVDDDEDDVDRMDQMLKDLQPELAPDHHDSPTPEVQKFFDLLKASEEPLHGHTDVTVLEFVTRLMSIKSKFAFSINCVICVSYVCHIYFVICLSVEKYLIWCCCCRIID
jgi:hypothetical protein